MASYPLQSISVLCGHCNTVVAAPRGHPVVRCGNCSSLLRVGGSVPTQNAPQNVRTTFMQSQQRRQQSDAASEAAIRSLERFEANESFVRSNGECTICADEFQVGQRVIAMPCEHGFHEECLDKWLHQKNTCPVCRHELPRADPSERQQAPAGGNPSALRGQFAYQAADPYFLEDPSGRPVFQGQANAPGTAGPGRPQHLYRIHRQPASSAGCIIS